MVVNVEMFMVVNEKWVSHTIVLVLFKKNSKLLAKLSFRPWWAYWTTLRQAQGERMI